MIGLFFFYQSPAPEARRSEPPRNILRQQADKEAGPDFEAGVGRKDQAGCANQSGEDEGDRDIEPRALGIVKSKKIEEHQRAAHGDGVHAYFEEDITDPAATDRQEGAQQKMDRDGRVAFPVLKDDPGPPIKDHG